MQTPSTCVFEALIWVDRGYFHTCFTLVSKAAPPQDQPELWSQEPHVILSSYHVNFRLLNMSSLVFMKVFEEVSLVLLSLKCSIGINLSFARRETNLSFGIVGEVTMLTPRLFGERVWNESGQRFLKSYYLIAILSRIWSLPSRGF